jgi:hypothetical protein
MAICVVWADAAESRETLLSHWRPGGIARERSLCHEPVQAMGIWGEALSPQTRNQKENMKVWVAQTLARK